MGREEGLQGAKKKLVYGVKHTETEATGEHLSAQGQPSSHNLLRHTKGHQANGKNLSSLEELPICIPEMQFDFPINRAKKAVRVSHLNNDLREIHIMGKNNFQKMHIVIPNLQLQTYLTSLCRTLFCKTQ